MATPDKPDKAADDRDKVQQDLLDIEKKAFDSDKDAILAEKALTLAIKILSTAIADMPMALAATAASFIPQKTISATAPVVPTIAATASPTVPLKPNMGNAMAGAALPAPTMGSTMAASAVPAPTMGTAMAGATSPPALPPPPSSFGNLGTHAAPGTAANPLPLPPPPPGPKPTLLEDWKKGAKEVGDAIKEAGKEAGQDMAGKIKAVGQALEKAWRNPVGTLAAGAKGAVGVAGKAAGAVGGGIEAVVGKLAITFGAVLAPLAILGDVVGSAASGFQVLSGSIKVLASVLAPLLLPVTIALSVAMLEFADKIQPIIDDVFPALADFIFNEVLPALEDFTKALADSIGWLAERGKEMGDFWEDTIGKRFGTEEHAGTSLLTGERHEGADRGDVVEREEKRRKIFRGTDDGGESGEERGARITASRERSKATGEVLEELKRSVGPKSQTLGLSAAYSSARSAALNASPFESRILSSVMKAVAGIDKVARNTTPRHTAAYGTTGAGDYSEDEGAGGGGDYGGGS